MVAVLNVCNLFLLFVARVMNTNTLRGSDLVSESKKAKIALIGSLYRSKELEIRIRQVCSCVHLFLSHRIDFSKELNTRDSAYESFTTVYNYVLEVLSSLRYCDVM